MYEPRLYRLWSADKDLVSFNVVVKETDLYIRAKRDLTEKAHEVVVQQRGFLEEYIRHHPGFATAMEPFPVENEAPDIVREMAEAAEKVGVGPMAAVAGAIAERVGRELLKLSPEVLVENGGDIFLKTLKKRRVGIYTGKPPFDGRVALEIRASTITASALPRLRECPTVPEEVQTPSGVSLARISRATRPSKGGFPV